jgi:N-acetylglutamate synthase-like GNAT family acetyltransferase
MKDALYALVLVVIGLLAGGMVLALAFLFYLVRQAMMNLTTTCAALQKDISDFRAAMEKMAVSPDYQGAITAVRTIAVLGPAVAARVEALTVVIGNWVKIMGIKAASSAEEVDSAAYGYNEQMAAQNEAARELAKQGIVIAETPAEIPVEKMRTISQEPPG